MSQDPLDTSGKDYKNNKGKYQPQYPADSSANRRRALSHEEMDYNLDLIGQVIQGYRVMGTGPDGALDLTNDVDKILKFVEKIITI